MTLELGTIDALLIAGFFAAMIWLGQREAAASRELEEFLLAGRALTLPVFVGTLVATWYGGIVGIGEIAYRDGAVTWLTQGGFWYASYLLFAFWLAGHLNRRRQLTLPDEMGYMHGPAARLIASLVNYLNVVPVAYFLSLGLLLHVLSGWPLALCIVGGALVTSSYALLGGFRAVVRTDVVQCAVMCCAAAALMLACVHTLGDGAYLAARLPPSHLRLPGALPVQELWVWAIIALSTLVDPTFYQRCYAAKSPAVARRGVLIAIVIWGMFDVCTVFAGVYARAALPDIDPRLAFPLLAVRLLPPGLRGFYFCGMLATVMSTIDSYLFVGAMSLSHDLFRRTLRPTADDRRTLAATRWGIVVTAALGLLLALLFSGSIKAIWKTLGSLSSAAMLVPMLLGFAGVRPPGAGAAALTGGIVGTTSWSLLRAGRVPWALRVEPMFPGLALSLGCFAGAWAVARRRRR